MTFTSVAPAKVILFGEHFVVHGTSAVLCAVDMFVKVSVSIINEPVLHIESKIESCKTHIIDTHLSRYVLQNNQFLQIWFAIRHTFNALDGIILPLCKTADLYIAAASTSFLIRILITVCNTDHLINVSFEMPISSKYDWFSFMYMPIFQISILESLYGVCNKI